jgi:hypothetical protein
MHKYEVRLPVGINRRRKLKVVIAAETVELAAEEFAKKLNAVVFYVSRSAVNPNSFYAKWSGSLDSLQIEPVSETTPVSVDWEKEI